MRTRDLENVIAYVIIVKAINWVMKRFWAVILFVGATSSNATMQELTLAGLVTFFVVAPGMIAHGLSDPFSERRRGRMLIMYATIMSIVLLVMHS